MSRSDKPKTQNSYEKNNKNQIPSFSSSLLDQIYRSIDTTSNHPKPYADEEFPKKIVDEAVFPRKYRPSRHRLDVEHENRVFGSTSSSSDSSSSIFSSSDTEFMYCKKVSRASCFGTVNPKPRKTEKRFEKAFQFSNEESLKKTKTPVSPGGRLASFINSLFINTKKSAARNYSHGFAVKSENGGFVRKPAKDHASDCSSVSSFSTSCLRRNTQKPFEAVVKRSVRFHPDNVVLKSPKNAEEEEEVMRDFLRDYEKLQKKEAIMMGGNFEGFEDEEDDDDAESESSSDLFELDVVGYHHRYREELPVYETTCAGLIM